MAIAQELLNENTKSLEVKKASLIKFDHIFGLDLRSRTVAVAPHDVDQLLIQRLSAKKQEDFKKSDELRKQIEDLGYEVMDTPEGQKVRKKLSI